MVRSASTDAVGVPAPPGELESRNIRNLNLDVAWQGITGAGISSFIGVFLVRLGASNFEVGLLSSVPALAYILLTIPAASFVEGRRDLVRIVCGGRLAARSTFLLVALVPFFFSGDRASLAPLAVVLLWGLCAAAASPNSPAFTAVFAEVVPAKRRPVIYGERLAIFSGVVAVAVAIFGRSLDILPFPLNYQTLFVLSFLAGLMSIYYFSRIRLSEGPQGGVKSSSRPMAHLAALPHLFAEQASFRRYIVSSFVYRLALSVPAAVGTIFWVRELGSPNTWIGFGATASNVALVVGYFLWGRLAGRRDHRRVLLICSVGLSLPPLMTVLVGSPEWIVPVSLVSGLFSAGIGISFFEGLLESCPPHQRATFSAVDTVGANVAAFIGPLAGTTLAAWIGLRPVFLVTAGLTLVGAFLLYILVVSRQVQPIPHEGAL